MVKKYTSFFYKVFYVVYIIIAIQCLALFILTILSSLLPVISPSQFEKGMIALRQVMPNLSYPFFILSLILYLVKLFFFLIFSKCSKRLFKNIMEKDSPFIFQNKRALKWISISFFLYYVIPIYPFESLELYHITTGFLVSSLLYLFSLILDKS